MKRLCYLCKNFDKNQKINCTFFKIVVPDDDIAKKCGNFISKEKRKRCKQCVHFTYSIISKKGKSDCYVCRLNKYQRGSYNRLTHCDKFKKIN